MTQIFESRDTGIQVTAMKYTGGILNVEKINDWIRSTGRQSRWEMPEIGTRDDGSSYRTREEYMEIRTVRGWKPAQLGEWIVRFSSGEFWSFTTNQFRDQYRPVMTQPEIGNHMNVATFVKKPEEYKAMQFDTIESAPTMVAMLREEGFDAAHFVDPLNGIDYPYINFAGIKVHVGNWVVIYPDGPTEALSTEEFNKQFVQKEPTVAQNNYVTIVRETAGGSSEFHVEAPAVDEYLDKIKPHDIAPKDERKFHNVIAWNGKLYTEREDGSVDDFEFRVGDDEGYDKHDEIVAANEDAIGVGGWIIDRSKYNEDTLFKVKDALDTLTVRQPYMNESKVQTGVTSETIIQILLNAGILFRERL